jgi:hypothetical protein
MPGCVAFSRPFSRTLIMEGVYDRLVRQAAVVDGPLGGGKRPRIRGIILGPRGRPMTKHKRWRFTAFTKRRRGFRRPAPDSLALRIPTTFIFSLRSQPHRNREAP